MLLTRVLTALLLIPLVVGAVLALPPVGLTLLLALVAGLSAYEWAQFALSSTQQRSLYAVAVAGLVVLLPVVLAATAPLWVVAGVLCWMGMALWMKMYPRGFVTGVGQPATRLTVGAVVLVLFAATALLLAEQPQGRWVILITLVLVWAMDVGGYFFGKRFGRRKLAPQISPNKSWEGLWGGALLALIVAAVAATLVLPLKGPQVGMFVLLGVIVALVSVLGDLVESMFKRQAMVKDSGTLLPGHGGILDRMDSSYAAMPAMLAGWILGGF